MKRFFTLVLLVGYINSNAQIYFESFENWTFVSPILSPDNWTIYPPIDTAFLNVERVSSLNDGQYAINLKSNIPHWEGNFTQKISSDLSFYSDTISIRFTYKCEGLGKCSLWLGQGVTGGSGVNLREIWVVNAGDTLVKTAVLENISINPPFNEFRILQYEAHPVETPTGSYGVCYFTIDSIMVQNSSFLPDDLETEEVSDICVYPNPAIDFVVFQVYDQTVRNTEILITDVLGQQMELLHTKSNKTIWDTRRLKPGTYFYKINIKGNFKSGKIMIKN